MTTFWGRGHTLLVFYWAVTCVHKANPNLTIITDSRHYAWNIQRQKTGLRSPLPIFDLLTSCIMTFKKKKKKKSSNLFFDKTLRNTFLYFRETMFQKIHCYPLKQHSKEYLVKFLVPFTVSLDGACCLKSYKNHQVDMVNACNHIVWNEKHKSKLVA